jgi:hypothetical protein
MERMKHAWVFVMILMAASVSALDIIEIGGEGSNEEFSIFEKSILFLTFSETGTSGGNSSGGGGGGGGGTTTPSYNETLSISVKTDKFAYLANEMIFLRAEVKNQTTLKNATWTKVQVIWDNMVLRNVNLYPVSTGVYTYNLSGLQEGVYIFRVEATTIGGNATYDKQVTVTRLAPIQNVLTFNGKVKLYTGIIIIVLFLIFLAGLLIGKKVYIKDKVEKWRKKLLHRWQ